MTVSLVREFWDEYERTGVFGPVRLGMSWEQLRAVLGEPEAVGGVSRKHRRPRIWKYGAVEFHFAQDEDELRLIYAEDEELNCVLPIYEYT